MSKPSFDVPSVLYDPVTGFEYDVRHPEEALEPKNPSGKPLTEAQKDRRVERGGRMPDGFGFIPDPAALFEALRPAAAPSARLFWWFASQMSWNTLEIPYTRYDIARALDLSEAYADQTVTQCLRDRLVYPLVPQGRTKRRPGVVAINPNLFWRGYARERHKALQKLHGMGVL